LSYADKDPWRLDGKVVTQERGWGLQLEEQGCVGSEDSALTAPGALRRQTLEAR